MITLVEKLALYGTSAILVGLIGIHAGKWIGLKVGTSNARIEFATPHDLNGDERMDLIVHPSHGDPYALIRSEDSHYLNLDAYLFTRRAEVTDAYNSELNGLDQQLQSEREGILENLRRLEGEED